MPDKFDRWCDENYWQLKNNSRQALLAAWNGAIEQAAKACSQVKTVTDGGADAVNMCRAAVEGLAGE